MIQTCISAATQGCQTLSAKDVFHLNIQSKEHSQHEPKSRRPWSAPFVFSPAYITIIRTPGNSIAPSKAKLDDPEKLALTLAPFSEDELAVAVACLSPPVEELSPEPAVLVAVAAADPPGALPVA